MKKVLFIVVLAVISLASCKKDRTCTCTTTSTQAGFVASPADVTVYLESKKHDARLYCVSSERTYPAQAGPPATAAYTRTETCELK